MGSVRLCYEGRNTDHWIDHNHSTITVFCQIDWYFVNVLITSTKFVIKLTLFEELELEFRLSLQSNFKFKFNNENVSTFFLNSIC